MKTNSNIDSSELPGNSHCAETVKCVVWDLDNTIWDGILLEGDHIYIRPQVIEVIKGLDKRGILNSIASRNEYAPIMQELKKAKIDEYFLYPQINWNPKSSSISKIAEALRLDVEAFAFVDDQEAEREEVKLTFPGILCLKDSDVPQMLSMPEFTPSHITDDASIRRMLYLADERREHAEQEFQGPKDEFLSTLGMELCITKATETDLDRVEELTLRTHQMNSTGRIYSREELLNCCNSTSQKLLVASLTDRFGAYGKIGIVLMDCNETEWHIRLLLMSCRVLNRGIGTIILHYLMSLAKRNGVTLYSDFVPTDRNRIMYITCKLAGFTEHHRSDNLVVLLDTGISPTNIPNYINIIADDYTVN